MNEQILSLLSSIEQSHNITIIYACEAGSRAWNLHHENSDYDLRFIFIHSLDQYLSLHDPKQVIDGKNSDNIEYIGWDLKKSLQLLKKQNPSILEWLYSTNHYINQDGAKQQLLQLQQLHFQEKPLLHHYFNMARTNLNQLAKKPSTKLLLNVIRPLLLCKWIVADKVFPPMNIDNILYIIKEVDVKNSILEIITLKRRGVKELQHIDPNLYLWLENNLELTKEYIDVLTHEGTTICDNHFNTYFRKVIKQQEY